MELNDISDDELMNLYSQSAEALREAIKSNATSMIDEYTVRHRAIVAACRAHGLLVVQPICSAVRATDSDPVAPSPDVRHMDGNP